jgi:probable phosphoglycerate mutase
MFLFTFSLQSYKFFRNFANKLAKLLRLGKKRNVFLCFALNFSYFCTQMTTIILVRHGETVDNARQIMQGQTQGELNEKGREQARQVAERLATEPIDAVVASDLHRAIQTAEIIAAPHGLPVRTTELLRERDWGSFTGRFIPDLRGETWPDDIESEAALLERARSFLIYITTTYPDKRVVAVGHGIVNKAILAVFAQCPMREVQRMMNAEVRILSTSARVMSATTTAACTTAVAAATASAEATAAVGTAASASADATIAVASAE